MFSWPNLLKNTSTMKNVGQSSCLLIKVKEKEEPILYTSPPSWDQPVEAVGLQERGNLFNHSGRS
jgi:hypothetical protein